jgi:hypothetical protein
MDKWIIDIKTEKQASQILIYAEINENLNEKKNQKRQQQQARR